MASPAIRLQPRFVERVWGTTRLSPYFPDSATKIGEVWFTPDDAYPLLVKFIFTSEKLSVQVHPDDAYSKKHEHCRGKTEMWHILRAEPGARIAIGFLEELTPDEVRKAVSDGRVEGLLNWIPVTAGETYFTPAGVVHAIGGGVTLCEIQQNSDITYRLYDYGRGRDLHIDKALDVAMTAPYDGRREMPVTCEHFTTEVLDLEPGTLHSVSADCLVVAVSGQGKIRGNEFRAGDVFQIPRESNASEISSDIDARVLLVRCGHA